MKLHRAIFAAAATIAAASHGAHANNAVIAPSMPAEFSQNEKVELKLSKVYRTCTASGTGITFDASALAVITNKGYLFNEFNLRDIENRFNDHYGPGISAVLALAKDALETGKTGPDAAKQDEIISQLKAKDTLFADTLKRIVSEPSQATVQYTPSSPEGREMFVSIGKASWCP